MIKIAICGEQCAGKTTCAGQFLETFKNSRILKFADPHYQVLNILKVFKDRLFMQEFSDLAKKHFGQDIFVKIFEKATEEIEKDDNIKKSILVCDDLRYIIENKSCIENDWITIYINCKEEIRHARSDKLGLVWSPNHISEMELPEFRDGCDYSITNNGSIEDFKHGVDNIIMNIIDRHNELEECLYDRK